MATAAFIWMLALGNGIFIGVALSDDASRSLPKSDHIFLQAKEYEKTLAPSLRIVSKTKKHLMTRDGKLVDPSTVARYEAMKLMDSVTVEFFLVGFPEKDAEIVIWKNVWQKRRFPPNAEFVPKSITIYDAWSSGNSIYIYYSNDYYYFLDEVLYKDNKFSIVKTLPLHDSMRNSQLPKAYGFFFLVEGTEGQAQALLLEKDKTHFLDYKPMKIEAIKAPSPAPSPAPPPAPGAK